jgi:hypothetical protein
MALTSTTPGWQIELAAVVRERLGPVEARRMATFFLEHPKKSVALWERLVSERGGDEVSVDELVTLFREAMKAGDA